MERVYRIGTRHLAVAAQRTAPGRFSIAVDGRTRAVEAARLDDSALRLVDDGAAHTVLIARLGDAWHVVIEGEVYVVTPEAVGDTAGAHAEVLAAPQIVAPMPGRVLQVLVQAGQQVDAGDGLLILEAMKMEHRIVAEAAATVRHVHVGDGEMVDAGVVLVELDYA